MKVGITYDLRLDYLAEGYSEEETAEFDQPGTIDAVEGALQLLGYETDRIGHVRNLAKRLVAGDRWDLVFNFAEGLRGIGREAQVPALLEAYGIPHTFSDTLVLSLALHKAMAKRVIRDLGIPTPDFAVVEKIRDVEGIRLPYPLFAKPMAEGTGKGITAANKIRTREDLAARCDSPCWSRRSSPAGSSRWGFWEQGAPPGPWARWRSFSWLPLRRTSIRT
jgi:D-alanine-D-alanine ligase